MTLADLIKPGPPLEADEGLEIHNPDCEYCLGTGEYYWHSSDCKNDDCRLAGGYGDCAGEMSQCGCSISDRLEDTQSGRKEE
jgi:hypothetical protein